ncbi:MAG: hypothetical protein GX428_12850 [Candidatus Atribacteria bacterium]|nr:hypothetical protein [Candidatus Atribacteria bacterium]
MRVKVQIEVQVGCFEIELGKGAQVSPSSPFLKGEIDRRIHLFIVIWRCKTA